MRFAKLFGFFLCPVLLGAVLVPRAFAEEWNKKAIVTTNAPIEISGRDLEPDTYVFKLAENLSTGSL